jgi:hypothetical protein
MITPGVCHSANLEFLTGVHTPGDSYYLALYQDGANLSPETTKYSTNGECSGQGYTAGGIRMEGYKVGLVKGKACLTFTKNPVWNPATIAARGALLYNRTKNNAAITVIDLGEVLRSQNGLFELEVPALVPGAALVTLGA